MINDFVIFFMHEIFRTLAKIYQTPSKIHAKETKAKHAAKQKKVEAIKIKCCI